MTKVVTEEFAPGTLRNEFFTVLFIIHDNDEVVQFVRTLLLYQDLIDSTVLSLITFALAGSEQHCLFHCNFTVKISHRQTCWHSEATGAGPDPDLACTTENNSLSPQVSSEAQDKTKTQESSPQSPLLCLHNACIQKSGGFLLGLFHLHICTYNLYNTLTACPLLFQTSKQK